MELPPLSPDIRRTHGAQLTFTPSPAVPPSRQNVAASTTQLSSPTRTVDRFSGKTHNTDKQESSNQDGKRTSLPKVRLRLRFQYPELNLKKLFLYLLG